MSRYLHISPDDAFEGRMRDALGTPNGQLRRVDTPASAEAVLTGEPAVDATDVVVLGPGLTDSETIELAARLDAQAPQVGVVAVAEPRAAMLADLLRVGVRDVVPPDASAADIRRSVAWAGTVAATRRGRPAPPAGQPEERDGRILVVASPKGGAGKTTVASNVAVTLAQSAPGSTVIVDLDLQFGDVASALQVEPEHTVADAVRALATADTVALKVYLSGHRSGLYALCAPESPADGERVSAEQAGELLRTLAREFRYVVVDTAAGLGEHTLAAMEVATDLVFVCTSDVPSVRNLHKELGVLEQLGMGGTPRRLVLNHAGVRGGIGAVDVTEAIGLPVDLQLPQSPAVLVSVNEGVPIVQSRARCPYARQIAAFAGTFEPAAAPRSRFGRGRNAR